MEPKNVKAEAGGRGLRRRARYSGGRNVVPRRVNVLEQLCRLIEIAAQVPDPGRERKAILADGETDEGNRDSPGSRKKNT